MILFPHRRLHFWLLLSVLLPVVSGDNDNNSTNSTVPELGCPPGDLQRIGYYEMQVIVGSHATICDWREQEELSKLMKSLVDDAIGSVEDVKTSETSLCSSPIARRQLRQTSQEETTTNLRRQNNKKRKLLWGRYIYRGGFRCMFCNKDDLDARRELQAGPCCSSNGKTCTASPPHWCAQAEENCIQCQSVFLPTGALTGSSCLPRTTECASGDDCCPGLVCAYTASRNRYQCSITDVDTTADTAIIPRSTPGATEPPTAPPTATPTAPPTAPPTASPVKTTPSPTKSPTNVAVSTPKPTSPKPPACCSNNGKSCSQLPPHWCALSETNCKACKSVYLHDGPRDQLSCLARGKVCSSVNDCCGGLACADTGNGVVCAIPGVDVAEGVPVSAGSTPSPTGSPTTAVASIPSQTVTQPSAAACCANDGKTCSFDPTNWCNLSGPNCNACRSVFLPTGNRQNCLARRQECNSGNGQNCCEGLVCADLGGLFMCYLPPYDVPADVKTVAPAPTIAPGTVLTPSPTRAPTNACCSSNGKYCTVERGNWCAENEDNCRSCRSIFLPDGDRTDNCEARWSPCTYGETCCPGTTCFRFDKHYAQCVILGIDVAEPEGNNNIVNVTESTEAAPTKHCKQEDEVVAKESFAPGQWTSTLHRNVTVTSKVDLVKIQFDIYDQGVGEWGALDVVNFTSNVEVFFSLEKFAPDGMIRAFRNEQDASWASKTDQKGPKVATRLVIHIPKRSIPENGRIDFFTTVTSKTPGKVAGFENMVVVGRTICITPQLTIDDTASNNGNETYANFEARMETILSKYLSVGVMSAVGKNHSHCLHNKFSQVHVNLSPKPTWDDANPRCHDQMQS